MPKSIALGLGLAVVFATFPAIAAQSSVDSQIFGKDPGKDHVFACFARIYDAAHLKGHPKQNVTNMTLLANSPYDGEADPARTYNLTLGIGFRALKQQFDAYGGCDGTNAAQQSLNCYIDCDGGAINVRVRDQNSILVDIPTGARIYDPAAPDTDDPDAGVPPKAEFGSDDKTFLLMRVALDQCAELADDEDKQALLDAAK
jgi:hypothetical protein